MHFGLLSGARTRRGPGLGDSHGHRGFLMVEHRFTGQGQVSASMTLLAHLAARTRTIRHGTAVVALPWHNPVPIAGQAAMPVRVAAE